MTAETRSTGTAGAQLSLSDVTLGFGSLDVVSNIDLDIQTGEFVCLLGPSGCGKSTLLTAMAGFVDIRSGAIDCAGASVDGPNPSAGMVFQQSDVLFDWMTVEDNVTYALRMKKAGNIKDVAQHYLSMIGLLHAAKKYPTELSGGMRQRVQIARVFAAGAPLILMDEPFGALDAQTRLIMQEELRKIWRQTKCTVVFVTHDIDEALALADRIIVMSAGPSAGIKSEYRITAPHPRGRADPELLEAYGLLQADIREEVSKSMVGQGIDECEA